jgi:hypothetical protein
MKRILMSIVMLVSALNIFAEPDVKVRMGLQAGYNMSSWTVISKRPMVVVSNMVSMLESWLKSS